MIDKGSPCGDQLGNAGPIRKVGVLMRSEISECRF